LKEGFPGIEITGLGMGIDGKPRMFLEIPYLGKAVLMLLRQNREYVPRQGEEVTALPAALFYSPPQFPGIGLEIKDDI
jgi:hypothetical protein